MNDVSELLRRVADGADPSTLPDPDGLRRAADSRVRRTVATWSLAAVVAVAAGAAVAVGTDDGTPRPAPPVVTPSPTEPDTAVTAKDLPPPAGWDRVTVQPDLAYFAPRAVAVRDGRYVVVGDTSYADYPIPIWWSDDGRTWQHAATGPRFPNVWDVTAFDGGYVAVAPQGLKASTVWVSEDGDRWAAATLAEGFHAFAVSSTAAGLFAWDGHRLFRSTDGQGWEGVSNLPDSGRGSTVCFVEDLDGDVVLGTMTAEHVPQAWVLQEGAWASRSADAYAIPRWCDAHYTDQVSADGPGLTVAVLPYDSYDNTVFVRER